MDKILPFQPPNWENLEEKRFPFKKMFKISGISVRAQPLAAFRAIRKWLQVAVPVSYQQVAAPEHSKRVAASG